MDQKTILVITIGIFIIVSTGVLLYTEHPLHHELHTISTFIAIFLAILAFNAYNNYRITRILFSGFAFVTFGIAEGIEIIFDMEYHDDPVGLNEIRDYIIIVGLSLFAIGTIPRKNSV